MARGFVVVVFVFFFWGGGPFVGQCVQNQKTRRTPVVVVGAFGTHSTHSPSSGDQAHPPRLHPGLLLLLELHLTNWQTRQVEKRCDLVESVRNKGNLALSVWRLACPFKSAEAEGVLTYVGPYPRVATRLGPGEFLGKKYKEGVAASFQSPSPEE